MEMAAFKRTHARQVAEIHIEGQPRTFLTRLGPDFLTAMYEAMADSHLAFGTVVVDGDIIAGVGVVALDTNQLFREVKRHHWYRLIWPLVRQVIRHPSLVGEIIQTLRYPNTLSAPAGEAEILFMGLRRAYMRQGIAPRMVNHLLNEAYRRGCSSATTIIDKKNRAIRWTIAMVPGAHIDHEIELHGKTMLVYRTQLPLPDADSQ